MALLTLDQDVSSVVVSSGLNLKLAVVALTLAVDGLGDADTVVADVVVSVKFPELQKAAGTRYFLFLFATSYLLDSSLLLLRRLMSNKV